MNRKEVDRLYVIKPFKNYLKQIAIDNGKSVIDITADVMKTKNPLESLDMKKKRGRSFDFV